MDKASGEIQETRRKAIQQSFVSEKENNLAGNGKGSNREDSRKRERERRNDE